MQNNNKKEKIIDNAVYLFYELGYKECTLRKIAKACDMSHVAILNYCKEKNELASILIERYFEGLFSITEEFLKQNFKSSRNSFECVFFWWCAHQEILKRDNKFRRFFIGYFDNDYVALNDILFGYSIRVFRELFHFKMDKPVLYRKVDMYALAAAAIELTKLNADNLLTYKETLEYLIEIVVKLMDHDQRVSSQEIDGFIDHYIESDLYVKHDVFNEFLQRT